MTPTFTHSKVLGKYTPTPPVQSEELKAAYERIAALEADLEECAEYFKDRCDVIDGDYGEPSPNKEMRLYSTIQESLHGPGNF